MVQFRRLDNGHKLNDPLGCHIKAHPTYENDIITEYKWKFG